jgi:hypothetical protein
MCGLRDGEVAHLLATMGVPSPAGVVAAVDSMADDQLSMLHHRLDVTERERNNIEIPPLTRPEPTEDAPKKRGRKPKAEVATAPTA